MQRHSFLLILCTVVFLLTGCKRATDPFTIHFKDNQKISCTKIGVDQLADIPTRWNSYNYLVMTLKSSTSQRIYIGMNTPAGYNELGVTFYVPNAWTRCVIPLAYFRNDIEGDFDTSSTYNRKRKLTYINLEYGQRTPLEKVDSIGFRMFTPIGDQSLEIKSISLAKEDPDDLYMEETPAFDSLGQWALGSFEGKVDNESQLIAEWEKRGRRIEEQLLPHNQSVYIVVPYKFELS